MVPSNESVNRKSGHVDLEPVINDFNHPCKNVSVSYLKVGYDSMSSINF